MKEQLRKIVETIKNSTGQTQEQIALNMGYKGNAISGMLSPTGKVTKKFINAITNKYREILSENGKIKRKSDLSAIIGSNLENQIAVKATIKIILLKITELEAAATKRGYAEISLEIERMIQQEVKLMLDELRNE